MYDSLNSVVKPAEGVIIGASCVDVPPVSASAGTTFIVDPRVKKKLNERGELCCFLICVRCGTKTTKLEIGLGRLRMSLTNSVF